MSDADKLMSKLAEVNQFASHYKKRLSETFAIPTVLEMRKKSLKDAKVQLDYWTQRHAELSAEIAEKETQLATSLKWLDEHRPEYEKVADMASEKAQKLGQELAELLRGFEAGSNDDGATD